MKPLLIIYSVIPMFLISSKTHFHFGAGSSRFTSSAHFQCGRLLLRQLAGNVRWREIRAFSIFEHPFYLILISKCFRHGLRLDYFYSALLFILNDLLFIYFIYLFIYFEWSACSMKVGHGASRGGLQSWRTVLSEFLQWKWVRDRSCVDEWFRWFGRGWGGPQ